MKLPVILLGATGTIGKSTLDILRAHPEKFQLLGISAQRNVDAVRAIVEEFSPAYVAMRDKAAAAQLRSQLPASMHIIDGAGAAAELAATPCHMVVHGVVGAAGIAPLHAALKAGNKVALANKESLVCAGHLMIPLLKASNSEIYPVDSEHNALFQLMHHSRREEISSVVLTASGGPFLQRDISSFSSITAKEAIAHPNWVMGSKISVDSATMANKGLELIEAHYLFDLPPDKLDAIIHPQSLVHAIIHLRDGSSLAHLSTPDMRLPIAYALHEGLRPCAAATPLSLTQLSTLEFMAMDEARFPMFTLARAALAEGARAMLTYNTANEIAVEAFLQNRIRFTEIVEVVEQCLSTTSSAPLASIDEVLEYDAMIRKHTLERMAA